MGFRTIVSLSNDQASSWEHDPKLGQKIMVLSASQGQRQTNADIIGLTFVECAHADTQSLIIADGYSASPVAYTSWHRNQTTEQRDLALLKDLADRLGYRVVRKTRKD